ncbi:albusnodin family lasso peptide [Streptomyces sp. NPDC059783]
MTTEHTAHTATSTEGETVTVDLGDVAELTEGQGGGQSEDKRRAYNA